MGLIEDSYVSFVNLDHRKDRLAHIENELNKIGLKAERTRGIYPHEFDANDPRHQVMRKRTIGAIGCYTSQLEVMRKALALNKHAIVFEDDIVFASDFLKRVEYINNWLSNNEADVIFFGGTFHVGGKGPYWHTRTIGRDAELTKDSRMVRVFGAFSTHAYFVHKNSLRKVINGLEDLMKDSMGIDWSFIQMEPNLLAYCFIPGCCKQIDNESDQNPGSGEWTHFSRFSKLNGTIENSVYWWQDKMEDFDPYSFNWAEANTGNNFLTK